MIKLIFEREVLIAKLKVAASFIPKKAVISAHLSVLIDLRGDMVHLTAQNGEKQITVKCPVAKSTGEGKFSIPGRVLLSTISLMKEANVEITYKEGKSVVKCGKSKYKFAADDGEVYPTMARVDASAGFEASFLGTEFNSVMDVNLKFANKDNNSVSFQGVCFRFSDGVMNTFSSDGSSIAKVIASPRSVNEWEDIIIPAQTCAAVSKCVNASDVVDVIHDKKRIEISTPEIVVISSVVDALFPDVQKFYDKQPDEFVELNTIEVLMALQRLALVASEEVPQVTLSIKKESMIINTVNEAYQNYGDEEIVCGPGLHMDIILNLTLFKNIIEVFANDSFNFHYNDPMKPVFVVPNDSVQGNNKFFVVAPMSQLV